MILPRKGNKTFALRREMKTKEENSMKEKITTLVCFNLVNADGVKLRLYLGRDEGYADCYGNPDKGFRWSFVGSKIPMPVRAYTWFNGFPENIMLDWLKGNGWVLCSRVEMITGKATIYELPKSDEASKGNETLSTNRIAYKDIFDDVLRELVRNGKRITAVRVYRYAHGGTLQDCTNAVKEVCGSAWY